MRRLLLLPVLVAGAIVTAGTPAQAACTNTSGLVDYKIILVGVCADVLGEHLVAVDVTCTFADHYDCSPN